jgi:hypothetical protein
VPGREDSYFATTFKLHVKQNNGLSAEIINPNISVRSELAFVELDEQREHRLKHGGGVP